MIMRYIYIYIIALIINTDRCSVRQVVPPAVQLHHGVGLLERDGAEPTMTTLRRFP